MVEVALAVVATVALWWASTAVILFLDNRDRGTFGRTYALATAFGVVAVIGVWATRDLATPAASAVAFACGLALWAWQLLGFYTGFVSGPRSRACPPNARGIDRLRGAVEASLYHELAALGGAVLLGVVALGHANTHAFWAYSALWLMHLSAKINLFLGVPNLGVEFLPAHLRFLGSYMRRRPGNAFFPFAIGALTLAATGLAFHAGLVANTHAARVGESMVATLVALALAEHWFLVAPFDGNASWRPFLKSARTASAPSRDTFGAQG